MTPPAVSLPYQLSFDTYIDSAGKIPEKWGIPLEILPKRFQSLSRDLQLQLAEMATSFIKTLRWVQRTSGRQRPFGHIDFKWSADKKSWHSMPHDYSVRAIETRGINAQEEALDQALSLWKSGRREPLCHELVREALDIVHSNPRSALLIGVSAIETGLKEYIHFLVPNSNYILASMPSPPALTMMQEVIPALHRAANLELQGLPLGKDEANRVRKWITQRNQVAHGTKKTVNVDELDSFLRFVRAQLYQLDTFQGLAWAKTFVDPEESNITILD